MAKTFEVMVSVTTAFISLATMCPLLVSFNVVEQTFYVWWDCIFLDSNDNDMIFGHGSTLNDACINYIKKIDGKEIAFKDGSAYTMHFNAKDCKCSD